MIGNEENIMGFDHIVPSSISYRPLKL
jgi:hypothetical protein